MLNLTQDFRAAATGMAEGMAYLTARRDLWLDYPVLDLDEWSGTKNNCYNFALNRNTEDYLQPGQVGQGAAYKRPPHLLGFQAYSLTIYRGVEADGLRDLGHDFARAATLLSHGERPVSLFMSDDCGYHWMALWRSQEDEKKPLVWADKMGPQSAELCAGKASGWDITGIFRAAESWGQSHFAGFFAAPLRHQLTLEDRFGKPKLARIRHFEP